MEYRTYGVSRRDREPLRVLSEARPRAFILENVEGLAYEGKDEGLRLLLDAIDDINKRTKTRYRPVVMRLNAADYGVPQLRQRVFVVGEREGRKLTTPAATHVSPARERLLFEEGLPSYRTAWDALADVRPDSAEDLALKGKWAEILPSIPEGQNYLWHTGRMGCSLPIARRPRLPNGRGPSRRGSGRCRASTPRTRARARAIAPRHARFKPDSPPMDVYGPATRSYAMSRFEKRIRRPR